MKFTHTYKPTGKPCSIVSLHAGDTAVICFRHPDERPIKRVHLSDLEPLQDPRQSRTDVLFKRLRGKPTEYTVLHAIMCMSHGLSGDDYKLAESVFDGMRIAQRLDEMNAAVRESLLAADRPQN